ncbi:MULTISPECIES: hypothetical protein [unclassified Streptomyces]|uniref:hypothetical protein n=1 Tax=unclassified Streptomyces TaxID=2593676 RepID=UPI0033B93DC4
MALVEPVAITAGTTGGAVVAGAVGEAGAVVVGAADVVGGAVVAGGSDDGCAVVAVGDGAAEVAGGLSLPEAPVSCGPQPASTAVESAAVTTAAATASGDLLPVPVIVLIPCVPPLVLPVLP